MKHTVSRQVEMRKTKVVSQRVEVDATLYYPVGLLSYGIPSVVTPGGDRLADMDTEPVEKVDSDAVRGTKGNP